eukprot:TRINITY_DN34666_c0_g1_i2.p1 TRINITY_DN34666_c0_g1~~TRINITY_DN34666_c0_g1_i2.p1  ORF type:complete len:122 (+),score=19.70 TRINITY_DN34666_c0_g1_i2:93-458(+)
MECLLGQCRVRRLAFGRYFKQRIDNVQLPDDLEELIFECDQYLVGVRLPSGLQRLTLGSEDQSLVNVQLPSGLKSLCITRECLQRTKFVPAGVQNLCIREVIEHSSDMYRDVLDDLYRPAY